MGFFDKMTYRFQKYIVMKNVDIAAEEAFSTYLYIKQKADLTYI